MPNITAMQQAIEDLKFMEDKADNVFARLAYNLSVTICKQYIEKEKQRIIAAHLDGYADTGTIKQAEEYYRNTYKQ